MKNHMLRLAAGELRIKRGGFAAVAGQQNASTIRRLDSRGPMCTDVMKPRDAAEADGENEETKKPTHAQT
jgi:hypothetical protein